MILHDFRCPNSHTFEAYSAVDHTQSIPPTPCETCGEMAPRVFLKRRHRAAAHWSEAEYVLMRDTPDGPEYQTLLPPLGSDDLGIEDCPRDAYEKGFRKVALGTVRDIEQVCRVESKRRGTEMTSIKAHGYRKDDDSDRPSWSR